MAERWEALGATERSKGFHGRFNWQHPKALKKLSNILERESLEINSSETKAVYDIHQSVEKRPR